MFNLVLVVIQTPFASVLHDLLSMAIRLAVMRPDWGHINGIADLMSLMV